jgi:choline dehydrogenase-like flavoprotein
MITDARSLPNGVVLEADLCVVGGGPAGLTLAREFGAKGRDVLLVESGGPSDEPGDDALNAGATCGDPFEDLRSSRHRRLGGTAWIWNTFLGGSPGAKYTPLDPIDFEVRPWVPWSGWPFGREQLDPYYRRAHERCGLGWFDYSAAAWDGGATLLPLDGSGLDSAVYLFGMATAFTERAREAIARVRLLQGATVTRLELDPAGERVLGAPWASVHGPRGRIRARRFVLAAGGIENARLLLLSGATPERAPGNGHGWVGRGFMEHPRDHSLYITLGTPEPLERSAFYTLHRASGGQRVWGRLALSEQMLRSEKLLNASVTMVPEFELNSRGSGMLTQVTRRWLGRGPRVVGYQVELNLEQAPDPSNQVRLAERCDPLGSRQAEVHWRWREIDQTNLERVRSIVSAALERAGMGRVERIGSGTVDPNAHHHAGTTRMHRAPEAGVVDEHGRVHGVENLWIAGNSVFPAVGFANPTLTIVALALRLADHLISTTASPRQGPPA